MPKGKPKTKAPQKKKWRKGHHPGGRPTSYKPEFCGMAKLCIEDSGFSLIKLAKLFDVSRSTIYKWMEEHKEFSDTLEKARDFYDGIKIHKSLVKRAEGFAYNETTQEVDKEGKMAIVRKVRKYFPPDIASIKHWQVNRDPEKWKDRQNIDLSASVATTVKLDESDKQDILELLQGVKSMIITESAKQ